jgi:hypothetical protein
VRWAATNVSLYSALVAPPTHCTLRRVKCKVSEYEQHAAECRQLAAQMKNPQHKMQLEQMAAAWDMMAQSRRKQLARAAARVE